MIVQLWKAVRPVLLFVLCVATPGLNAQTSSRSKQEIIPLDPAVRYGKLSNGFTYYILKSEQPKNRIYFNLTVKAGHFQADQKQIQYAHLVEHMAFLGTKNYPPSAKYLATKAGLTFGREVSAQTSGNYTQYYIDVPDKNNQALVTDALGILKDYAQDMTFDTAKVNNERKVVVSELIERTTLENEVAYIQEVFPAYPAYGGKVQMDNLTHGSNEDVLRFYKDWYRPDMEAIIIVGDIDVSEMEKKVKTVFATVRPVNSPRKRIEPAISLDGKNRFMVLTQGKSSDITLTIVSKRLPVKAMTREDYRELGTAKLVNQLIAARLENIKREKGHAVGRFMIKKDGAPGITGPGACLQIEAKNPGLLKDGLIAIVTEVERINRYGFSEAEMAEARRLIAKEYQDQLNHGSARSIASNLVEHFAEGLAAPGPQSEYELKLAILSKITSSDIAALTGSWWQQTNRDIIIQAVNKEGLPGETTVLHWIDEARNTKIEPYTYHAFDKELFTPGEISKLSSGAPVATNYVKDIDVTELTLANGVKVILKRLKKEQLSKVGANRIELQGFAPGGTLLYSDSLFWEAKYASSVVASGNVGPLTDKEVDQFRRQKKITVFPYVDEEYRGIRAAATEDIESMLQLVYRYFTAAGQNEEAFAAWVLKEKEKQKNSRRPKSGSLIFGDSIHAILYNYNFRELPPREEDIDRMQQAGVYKIYNELFSDAGKFTFVMTGDFIPEKAIPLLTKYLGALPSRNKSAKLLRVGGVAIKRKYPRTSLTKTYPIGDDAGATVDLKFFGLRGHYSDSEHVKLLLLENYLYNLLMKRLRDTDGSVYGVRVNYADLPPYEVLMSINFVTSPANLQKVMGAIKEEIQNLQINGVNDSLFNDSMKLVRESSLNTDNRNWFLWQGYLVDQYRNNRNPQAVLSWPSILDQVTAEELKEVAKKYLDNEHLQQFILLPRQK